MNLLFFTLSPKALSRGVSNESIQQMDAPSKEFGEPSFQITNEKDSTKAIEKPNHQEALQSKPILKSCLKSTSRSDKQCHVTFAKTNQYHLVEPTITSTAIDSEDDLIAMSLLRDKTILQTEPIAWSYTWAYDAARLQFEYHDGRVDASLQRTLLYGLRHDHGTLERFSGDGRGRRQQALERRRAVVCEYEALLCDQRNGAVDGDGTDSLARFCQRLNRPSEQWAIFMGRLQSAAVAVAPVPLDGAVSTGRQPLPRAKSSWRWSFRERRPSSKRISVALSA